MMLLRRLTLLAFDILAGGLGLLVVCALTPEPAYAYVDPSVMTYTIQALAGVAVALGAVLGVALRRTRRVIMRVLHIDENANKEVDPPVHRIDTLSEEGVALRAQADEDALRSRLNQATEARAKTLSWPERFLRALLASAFLIGTVFIVAPLEVVAGSSSSLIFGITDVALLVIGAGLGAALILALLLSVIRGRAFDVVLTVVIALGLCCYLQALFLNWSLPIADGRALNLGSHKKMTIISTIVWALVIAGLLIISRKKVRLWRTASVVLCLLLVIVQGVGVISLIASYDSTDEEIFVTREGLFDVGSKGNIIVIVLDRFDTQEMNHLLEEDSALLDEFTGFTYFEDSVGAMLPTRYGIPYLLTGFMPESETADLDTFIESWYERSTLLPDLESAGYSLGIYSPGIETGDVRTRASEGLKFVKSYATNLQDKDQINVNIDQGGALRILGKVALYRDMPWLLKPLFWFYTDDVNNEAIEKDQTDATPYKTDDAAYSRELSDRGLALSEDEKVFRFIHLNGAHAPFTLDENGYASAQATTRDQQCKGSIKIVDRYLQQLKELGIYNEATIIITADHGDYRAVDFEKLTGPTSPILLVKPSEDEDEAAQPLKVSDVPTGHLDFAATLIAAAGGDASGYGPTVFEVEDGSRLRSFWMITSDNANDFKLREFEVDGPALDFDSWRATGVEIGLRK